MGVSARTGSRRLRRVRPRRDERGGAISLWVVLMVPVSGFAAVVAMAGPQRVAAESTMQDAADDLAMLAVAWRDGQGPAGERTDEGPLHAFPPECSTDGQPTHRDAEIDDIQELIDGYQDQIDNLQLPRDSVDEQRLVEALQAEKHRLEPFEVRRAGLLDDWRAACDLLFESLLRDLGYLGVDMNSLRGFYSDSLKMSPQPVKPPCRASAGTMVEDAVHVALAADWQDAGWAAAQVWPDGTRMAAESVGRLSRRDATTVPVAVDCNGVLTVLDERGRPKLDPTDDSRMLTRSVARTSLSG